MLPGSELSDIRDEAELALPDTCTIQTGTQANTKGSVETTYANTYTGVAFRLASANNKIAIEKQIGTALAAVTDYIGTVPFDQAVAPSNRVVHSGVTYEVVACQNDLASWRSVRRVYLKRIQ